MKSMSGNSLLMKEVNTNIVRNALKIQRQATKQKLAELTGLSTVTIGSILMQLTKLNEVYENDLIPSKGGRPAHRFCYNSEFRHVLILYTHEFHGQDRLYIHVVNLLGESIHNEEAPLENVTLNSFQPAIQRLIEQFPTIKAIGFGMPGSEYNEVIKFHDYEKLNGTRFSEYYRNLFHLPVAFENDVNAAVIGYCQTHTLETSDTTVYVYFPEKYPPGAGIYINDSLYKGFSNFEGEIKYIPLSVDWNTLDYHSFSDTCNALVKLTAAITCMFNPKRLVLAGDFITVPHIEYLRNNCENLFPGAFMPQLIMSESFHQDYKKGVIKYTLDLLEPKLTLNA